MVSISLSLRFHDMMAIVQPQTASCAAFTLSSHMRPRDGAGCVHRPTEVTSGAWVDARRAGESARDA